MSRARGTWDGQEPIPQGKEVSRDGCLQRAQLCSRPGLPAVFRCLCSELQAWPVSPPVLRTGLIMLQNCPQLPHPCPNPSGQNPMPFCDTGLHLLMTHLALTWISPQACPVVKPSGDRNFLCVPPLSENLPGPTQSTKKLHTCGKNMCQKPVSRAPKISEMLGPVSWARDRGVPVTCPTSVSQSRWARRAGRIVLRRPSIGRT